MVDESGVFVAIIGPGWMGVSADPNERRIDEVNDFVRLEIASALERSKRVIPVLVRGATMPAEEALPPPIKKLTYKNGMSIRPDPDFDHDVRRLIDGIEAALRSQ